MGGLGGVGGGEGEIGDGGNGGRGLGGGLGAAGGGEGHANSLMTRDDVQVSGLLPKGDGKGPSEGQMRIVVESESL